MWRNRKETASSHVITKTKIDNLKFFKILRDFFSIIVLHKDINVARSLILLSAIFHFSSIIPLEKKAFFVLKIFSRCSSPLFPSLSHFSRKWSKLNLQVYDVINWLNKNLRKHIVWYIEKQKVLILKLGRSIEY